MLAGQSQFNMHVTAILNCTTIKVFYIHVTVHHNKFLFNKTNRRTNFPNLFLLRNSTCFGHSSAHHQELSTVHSALVCVVQVWWHLIKPTWHIPVPNVQWKTPDDGQRNCPKHVEFLDKNKFGKLVRLLVLLKIHNNRYFSNFRIRPGRSSNTMKLVAQQNTRDWYLKLLINWHRI